MRTILVEEWVNIPEGGKHKTSLKQCPSYCDRKDKIREGEGPQGRDHQELPTHAS